MARKPDHIEEFIPYSRLVKKMSMWRSVVASRMEYAKHLIANQYNIDPDKVKSIFLKAWDKSTKDYPSPKFPRPSSTREFEAFNNYILYLWEYYVNNKDNPEPPKEPEAPKEDAPVVDDNQNNKDDKKEEKPTLVVVTTEEDKKDTKNEQDPASNKTYEGVGGEDLVDEDIDPRILRLLGLEDVFDIDYDTYKTLLKEKMAAGRMSGTTMPSEETELLTEEFKRVKKKVGRFKVKRKKTDASADPGTNIKAAKGFLTGAPPPPPPTMPPTVDGADRGGSSLEDNVAAIRKTVESILGIMENQFSMMRKQLELDRRTTERRRRKGREDALEASGKKAKELAKRVLAPAFNLLDRIIKFITTILIGRALVKLVDWISNPANQKKLKSLLRFIGDWWPAILAAFVLFATPLGQLIRFVMGTIAKLTLTIAKKGIPAIANFIRRHPLAAAAIAAGTGAAVAATQLGENREKLAEDDPNIVQPGGDKTPSGSQLRNEEVMQRGIPAFSGGGRVPRYAGGGKMLPSRRTQNSSAGKITPSTGKRIRGAGKDTQLVAAQPGEIVISKKAVDKFGAPFFLNLNKMGGGTNKPKYSRFSDIQFAQGGGQIGVNINDGLNDMSIKELSKLLDPTEPGARRPHVFKAAREARQRYSNAPREEQERQALIATIRAVRSPVSSENVGSSPISTASRPERSGSSMAGMVSGRPPSPPSMKMGQDDKSEDVLTGPPENVLSPSKASAPFMGKMLDISKPIQNSPTPAPPPAMIGKGSSGVEPPPPPEPGVEIIAAKTSAGRKYSGTGAQPAGNREMDTDFPSFIQTESRLMMLTIYGITGVE